MDEVLLGVIVFGEEVDEETWHTEDVMVLVGSEEEADGVVVEKSTELVQSMVLVAEKDVHVLFACKQCTMPFSI